VPESEIVDDVGPRTVQRLDEIALASEQQPETPDPIPPALVEATDVAAPALLALPGVTGLAAGFRLDGDEVTEDLTVYVFVADESETPPGIPSEVGGVGVSVIEMEFVPCADEARYPQLEGGIRISHPSQRGGGTLGAIVKDNSTGELLGLSNQ